jgi:hypothetical protein
MIAEKAMPEVGAEIHKGSSVTGRSGYHLAFHDLEAPGIGDGHRCGFAHGKGGKGPESFVRIAGFFFGLVELGGAFLPFR